MKKTRKMLALFLCLCVTMTFMPLTAFATGTADDWDGTADTSWYDATNSQSSYRLSTAEQFAGLAELVNAGNDFLGVTFILTSDINLLDQEWIPVGKGYMDWNVGPSLGFSGVFDGGGHTVSGLQVTVDATASNDGDNLGAAALFGYLLGGTVKNVTVKGFVKVADHVYMGNSAGIVGYSGSGTVENCINYAAVTNGSYTTGGIVGYNDGGVITKCINYGDITKTGAAFSCTGGIAGYSANGKISLCRNAGAVTFIGTVGAGYVGGIVGTGDHDYPNVIQNCYNSGSVSTNWSEECGGIIGGAYAVEITACYNSGFVTNSANAAKCGAIGGDVSDPSRIVNSYYLDISCGQGYASEGSVAPENVQISAKTASELNSAVVLDELNQTAMIWGFARDVDYPAFLYTIPADYTSVQNAKANIPAVLDVYTNETVQALNEALSAIVEGKMADEQATVDGYAQALQQAVNALRYRPADYSVLDAALAKVPADLSLYTEDTAKALADAIDAVEHDKDITEQAAVNTMAKAIDDAVAGLIYKSADYGKVDEAINRANALNREEYHDFSTVDAAVYAVVRGKNITEQAAVNAMAKAIDDAVAGLIKKTAESDPVYSDIPVTGDTARIALWLTLFVGAGGVTGVTLAVKKGWHGKS